MLDAPELDADVLRSEPDAAHTGHAGMAQAISAIQAVLPGTLITRSGPIQSAQELTTYTWNLGPSAAPVVATGRDVIIVRDGKIAALYVIIDVPDR